MELEEFAGVQLPVRNSRGTRVTPAGPQMLAEAKSITRASLELGATQPPH